MNKKLAATVTCGGGLKMVGGWSINNHQTSHERFDQLSGSQEFCANTLTNFDQGTNYGLVQVWFLSVKDKLLGINVMKNKF